MVFLRYEGDWNQGKCSVKKTFVGILVCALWIFNSAAHAEDERPAHVLFFAGLDGSSLHSYAGFAGAIVAPDGLDNSGLRFGLFAAGGSYRYDNGITTFNGRFTAGDALIGYGFNWNALAVKVMAGVNVQTQDVTPVDIANPVQGMATGAKAQVDVYATPTENTMFFALGSYSTAYRTYYSEGKVGYAAFGVKELYIGPHVSALGNERFDQWRVGAHLSGIPVSVLRFNVAGGYLNDNSSGPGYYGVLTMLGQF